MSWPPLQRDTKSAEFFDAAAAGHLLIKQCDECARALAPEASVCTACAGPALHWLPAAGNGTLVTWTTVHKAPNPAYTDRVPYVVGVVELTEGPWLYGRIDTETLTAGMALTATFVHGEGGESYPIFTGGDRR
jgi:uncharacterized protein